MKFRALRADEIDIRIGSIKDNGCTLLLYKDARCDMNILDETFGAENWQRKHYECKGNLFCSVGIKNEIGWVWKDDCGTESNAEKEKGEASDSFKRACFNWGIGRELYTSPFIWLSKQKVNIEKYNNKNYTKDKFHVKEIGYTDGKISKLYIANQNGTQVFFYKEKSDDKIIGESAPSKEKATCDKCGKEVKPMKKGDVEHSASQSKGMMGGMCLTCYKAAKNGN